MFHVAIGISNADSYVIHALTMLVSLFSNTKSAVTIHVIHDGTLMQQHIDCIRKIAAHFEQHVVFYPIDDTTLAY